MKKILLIIGVLLMCSSCAILGPPKGPQEVSVKKKPVASEQTDAASAVAEPRQTPGEEQEQTEAILEDLDQRSSDFNEKLREIISDDGRAEVKIYSQPAPDGSGEKVEKLSIDFFDADIVDVIQLFMQVLDENYTMHSGLGGRVTLHIEDHFNRAQLVDLLEGILQLNGATMLKNNGMWEIMPLGQAPARLSGSDIIMPEDGKTPTRGQIIQGFRLRFLAASEILNIIKPYLTQGALVYANDPNGVLLICDYPHTLSKIAKLIELFDVSVFAELKIRVFALKYVLAADMIKELEAVAKTSGIFDQKGMAGVSFVALERLNMICVLAKNERTLEFIEAWINELDRDLPQIIKEEQEENIFVYYVQNGDAEEIHASLGAIFDSSAGTVNVKPKAGEQEKNVPLGKQLAETQGKEQAPAQAAAPKTDSGPSAISGELSGPVTFVVDATTNSILIRCKGSDYKKIEAVIKKLDIYPKQALIEVVIAEVLLDESNKLGVEWRYILDEAGRVGSIAIDSGLGMVSGSGESSIASGVSFLVADSRFSGLVKAFAGNNNVQILSSPHILASNHKEAKIDIGDEVPLVTSEFQTSDAGSSTTTTERTIQYKNVGILLTVTPHINDNGLVRMEVTQEISETSNKSVEGVTAPVFSKRQANTAVAVNDGQTIVIGGLIKQTRTKAYSGLPILSKIPLLKYFFGYEAFEYKSTELLIFITPHVIAGRDDTDVVSENFVKRLETIKASMQ